MLKKIGALVFALALLAILTPLLAQDASKPDTTKESTDSAKTGPTKKDKAAEGARWEGRVTRSSKDKSTLTVLSHGLNAREKTIHYDNSTRWVSQEHGSKKVTDIDPAQVKDGDRVIVLGTQDSTGEIHATLISKRLTPRFGSGSNK
jgi:hypothetical protein